MNKEQIRHNIISRTDDELIEILVSQSEYREEFVLIAKAEIKNRPIYDKIFKEKWIEISKKTTVEKKRTEDLSSKEKVVSFFGIFIFVFRVLGFYRLPLVPRTIDYVNAGYERKAEKIIIYKTISIIFWFVFIIVAYISCDSYLAEKRRIKHEKSANPSFNIVRYVNSDSLKLAG